MFFFGFGSTQHFFLLSLQKMSELCLQVYLAEYEEKLHSGDFLSVPSTAEGINHIFESLYHPVIIHRKSYVPIVKYLDGTFKEVCCLFPISF